MAANQPTPEPNDSRVEEFVQLLAEHERKLNACILALVPNWADAEDIAQQTKLQLWRQFDEYDPSKDFGAWARTIARYAVRTARKQSERHPHQFGDDFLAAVAEETTAVEGESDSRYFALADCLKLLSGSTRELLQRCYQSGTTIKTIAEQLHRKPDALYKELERGRRSLHDCIERKISAEDDA